MVKSYLKHAIIICGDILTVILVFYSWFSMFSGSEPSSVLSSPGVAALKYFTIDSNLLMGISAVISLICTACVHGRTDCVPVWAKLFRYIAVVSVMLTFSVTFLFLARLYGVKAMIRGVILYLHLIVPFMSLFLLIFMQCTRGIRLRASLAAVVPMLVYGTFYMLNIIVHGRTDANDWYGFARWGSRMYLPVILLVALLTWILAVAVWAAGGGLRKDGRTS